MLGTFPTPAHMDAAPNAGPHPGHRRRLTKLVADCLAPAINMTSALTPDGSPLEVGYSAQSPEPRFTIEAAPPESPVVDRLAAVQKAAQDHGIDLPSPEKFAVYQQQMSSELEFGSWLGIRSRGTDIAAKLYVEVPRNLDPVRLQIPGHPAWRGLSPRLVGLSYAPCGGSLTELYFGGAPATRGGLSALLFEAGLRSPIAVAQLFDVLQRVRPGAASQRLSSHDVGVSFAHGPDGTLLAVSVLLYAEQVFGSEPQAYQRIAYLFDLLDGDARPYSTAVVAEQELARHTILSLTMTSDGSLGAHIGLSTDPHRFNVQQERLIQ